MFDRISTRNVRKKFRPKSEKFSIPGVRIISDSRYAKHFDSKCSKYLRPEVFEKISTQNVQKKFDPRSWKKIDPRNSKKMTHEIRKIPLQGVRKFVDPSSKNFRTEILEKNRPKKSNFF